MSWRDREYNQSEYGGRGSMSPLMSMLLGSVPIGMWFGIRVRLHASLIIFIALILLLGPATIDGFDYTDAITSMAILFCVILLHEFGHCFAARRVGGSADEIIMSPLGGLAFAQPPHRPWPTFITVVGGPAVNVAICLITGAALFFITGGIVPFNPFNPLPPPAFHATNVPFYLWWVFIISYITLLFNLLPIFPLDGGRIVQSALWPQMGYFRSMNVACVTGMTGAVIIGLLGLVTGKLLLFFIAISGFLYCYQMRMQLKEMGPEGLHDAVDYSASLRMTDEDDQPRRKKLSARAMKRIRKRAQKEQQELARIDAILDKVAKHGMHSLNWWERRALRKATERQRQRDLELAKAYRA
jgi:Zn-dependent protease